MAPATSILARPPVTERVFVRGLETGGIAAGGNSLVLGAALAGSGRNRVRA